MVVFFQAKRCTLKNIEALLNFKLQPIWITNENNIYETTWSIETSEWFKANIPDLKTYRTYRSRPKFHGVSLSLRSLQREAFQTRVGIPIAASARWTSRRLGWRFEVRKSVNISFAKNFNTTTLQLYFENKQCSLSTENISENIKQQRITQMLSCTYMVNGAHPTISQYEGLQPFFPLFLVAAKKKNITKEISRFVGVSFLPQTFEKRNIFSTNSEGFKPTLKISNSAFQAATKWRK